MISTVKRASRRRTTTRAVVVIHSAISSVVVSTFLVEVVVVAIMINRIRNQRVAMFSLTYLFHLKKFTRALLLKSFVISQ